MELPIMQQLKKELEDLRYELNAKLPQELEKARAHGDLSENAEYDAAKNRQGFVSARIGQMEQRIRELSMYSVESIPHDVIAYGSQVTLENLDSGETETYEIVFPEEVNAAARRVSLASPMGRALLNKGVGDEIEVRTPRGTHTFEIIDLQTLHDRNEISPE